MSSSSSENMAAIANKTLRDPKLLNALAEQVYALMREDLRHQQERVTHYHSGRGLV